jgi:hypothetical protein
LLTPEPPPTKSETDLSSLRGVVSYGTDFMTWLQIFGNLKQRAPPPLNVGKLRSGDLDNTSGSYRKEKKMLLSLLDNLDKKAESGHLSDQDINLKHYLKEHLVSLLREEELKWYETKLKPYWKVMLTLGSFTWLLMANIVNNMSLNLRMIKVLLLEMIA